MADPDEVARARQKAEQRAIIQATMAANRAGKLPKAASTTGSEVVTAIVVVVLVFGLLAMAMRYGN